MANDTDQEFKFTGQGTLDRIDTFVSKAGKDILTLVLRTGGQYPQLVPIKAFGRLAEEVRDYKPGNVLRVTGRMGGRDWNGKVYGDNVAESVELLGAGSAKGKQSRQEDLIPPPSDADVPF